MSKISVILCTYNRQEYLKRVLKCISEQKFTEYELILVNNGSTDDTSLICEKAKNEDSRIRLITISENRGASVGKNAGINAVRCDYFTIIDDDDTCDKQMLKFLWDLVIKYDADIAICGSQMQFDGKYEPYFVGDELYVLNRLEGLRELLKRERYNVAPPTKLFKTMLWQGLFFPDNTLVDDIHVVYKVFEKANKIVGMNLPLYNFTKHQNNMTSFIHQKKMTPELLDEYIEMYFTRAEYLSKKAPEIKGDIHYSILDFMKNMCKKIDRGEIINCEEQLQFMKKYIEKGDKTEDGI